MGVYMDPTVAGARWARERALAWLAGNNGHEGKSRKDKNRRDKRGVHGRWLCTPLSPHNAAAKHEFQAKQLPFFLQPTGSQSTRLGSGLGPAWSGRVWLRPDPRLT